ncbi:MAG: replication-associated recombination protein A [Phycisphaerae bacterium]|nr:replication-associated recombination protein A [Phycisphaerae bacterium]
MMRPVDLFDEPQRAARDRVLPLAARLRPRTMEEFVGQQHFLGPGRLLRRLLAADRLTSAIFYGPPGTGKTTLAHLIAAHTQAAFEQLHAAAAGVKEVREVLGRARARIETSGRRTVLFIDEIHRFNRAQQDVLLGDVEDGIVILVGATTENPFFAINSPLVSRSQIFQFEPLSEADVTTLIRRALGDSQRGLGAVGATITEEALAFLAKTCDGDARRALSAVEVAVRSLIAESAAGEKKAATPIVIDLAVAQESIQRKAIVYDGTGDEHYDAASALIKSMRGSDPDATVYWLARMLEAGEDPRFVARRIAICAAEDVGNADPQALVLASAAAQVTQFVGMPECQLPLAQAAIYIACAPKSNASATAIWNAMSDVRNGRTIPVPRHLRDASYRGARRLGHGEGYQYAHDQPGGMAAQDYLGVDRTYYEPTDRGHERVMAEYLARFKALREQAGSSDERRREG